MALAIITGASRGLGLELARALARRRVGAGARRPRRRELEAATRRAGALTEVVALPGDVGDPEHRRALVAAAGETIDLLVNNASVLGPSPQPSLADYPLRRTGAGVPDQHIRAARARPARAASPAGRRADHQRDLRCGGRGLRGMGWLRILEGGARAAVRHPRRGAAVVAGLRGRSRGHANRSCSRRPFPARTSPTVRRRATACPGCSG